MQWFSDLLAILMSMFIIRSCTAIQPTVSESQNPQVIMQDLNQNGLWDDVENKINETWKSEHPNIREAASQMAIALQDALDESLDLEIRDKALSEATACMLATEMQHSKDWYKSDYTLNVRDMVISNPERIKKYIKYNGDLNGKVINIPSSSLFYCKYTQQKG